MYYITLTLLCSALIYQWFIIREYKRSINQLSDNIDNLIHTLEQNDEM